MNFSDPMLTLSLFSPPEVYATRVGERRLVYLDQNIWIELRDQTTRAARACRDACVRAFNSGKALFPLSHAAITECVDIADIALRGKHADLMDQMSGGVTFRPSRDLFALEARIVHLWLFHDNETSLARTDVLTSVPEHVGPTSLVLPPGVTENLAYACLKQLSQEPDFWTVRRFAFSHDWKSGHLPARARYVAEMTEALSHLALAPRLQKQAAHERALLRERIGLFKSCILKESRERLFVEVGPDGVTDALADLHRKRGDGGKRRIREMFARCPLLDLHARLLALDSLELRRTRQEQDFFDFEHAAVAPIYADAFVTLDGRLANLLRATGQCRAQLLSSLDDLTEWLGC